MKNIFIAAWGIGAAFLFPSDIIASERMQQIYDTVTFYDGYKKEIVDADREDGILRHANYLYARPLSEDELNWFGSDLRLEVLIDALCDNYDRIGNVNLAFVEKGAETYLTDQTPRIEIARFITPFMNKNVAPGQVPYQWQLDNVALIMRDSKIREKYDIWVEFELFGMPYSARQQVKGCEEHDDVFAGTLRFYSDSEPKPVVDNHSLYPIKIKNPEFKGHNLNNYSEAGTDEIGRCVKSYSFDVEDDMADMEITLVMSNHGANADGEEYNRRRHMIYFDSKVIDIFTPGGKSCEEFRKYNTQPNGIYGLSEKSEAGWTSWNNWCPGDRIPIHTYNVGAVQKGQHTIKIKVTDAVFPEGQGDFPVSLYAQGVRDGKISNSGVNVISEDIESLSVNVKGEKLYIETQYQTYLVEVYDLDGTLFYQSWRSDKEISMEGWPAGIYIANILTASGEKAIAKFVK